VLFIVTIQYALHTLNHLFDINGTDPKWQGYFDFISLLSLTVLLALVVYYFVGVDEGMTSVFGKTMVIHEWVHDARHFLGFPCH